MSNNKNGKTSKVDGRKKPRFNLSVLLSEAGAADEEQHCTLEKEALVRTAKKHDGEGSGGSWWRKVYQKPAAGHLGVHHHSPSSSSTNNIVSTEGRSKRVKVLTTPESLVTHHRRNQVTPAGSRKRRASLNAAKSSWYSGQSLNVEENTPIKFSIGCTSSRTTTPSVKGMQRRRSKKRNNMLPKATPSESLALEKNALKNK